VILITPSSVVLSVGLYPWMFFNVYIQRYKNAPSKTSNKYILWPRKALVPQYIFIIYFRSIFILSTYIILFLMYIRQDPPTINKLSSIYIRRKNSNFVTKKTKSILPIYITNKYQYCQYLYYQFYSRQMRSILSF
jgi:hypothetical protein